ncbi:50S ribosomal protein L22 [Candidatus Magnetomorum sp. HK-1]|nr:50S ribosomal protein L22 [Candidatus Magnetomorum sp. HK-1]
MEARAVAKYMRISPQKVRKLAQVIKGKKVESGLDILKFMPQKASGMVYKVINSAVSNATTKNDSIDVDDLIIKNIYVDQGPTLKRFRARARGRGTRILKRTSHITVILTEDTV